MGNGVGDLNIKGICGIIQSETYSILDAKKYIPNSQIVGFRYNNDRYLYYSDYEVNYGDEIHFRFKTVPSKVFVGLGRWDPFHNDILFMKDGDTFNMIRDGGSSGSRVNLFSTDYDFVLKPVFENNAIRCYVYKDDVYFEWFTMYDFTKHIRIDRLDNNIVDVDIIIL